MTEVVVAGGPAHVGRRFVGVCLGSFLVILDAVVLNVAAPTIRADLRGGPDALLWVLDSYTLVFAALLLSAGALAARRGQLRIFILGSAIFVGASLLCGFATATPMLLTGRALQGIGAALVAPTALTLISILFPERQERAHAFGIWAGVQGIAFAAGPVVGGALVAAAGWRSIFFLNVPCGIALLLLLWGWSPADLHRSARIPLRAQALALVGLGSVTFGLIETSRWGWTDPIVVASLALSAIAVAGLLQVERHGTDHLLSRAVLASPAAAGGLMIGAVFNFCMYGTLFVFTVQFQDGYGYSALQTGLAFLPLTVLGTLASVSLGGRLTARYGARLPLALGMTFGAIGALTLSAVGAHDSYLDIALGFAVFGFGCGLTTPPMTTTVMSGVHARDASAASAMLNASRQLGGVLGVALLGALQASGHFTLPLVLAAAAFVSGGLVALQRVPGRAALQAEMSAA